jgi:hypothetical protein
VPFKAASTDQDKIEWQKLLVGLLAPLYAQRRFAGCSYDSICTNDIRTVDRVLACISSTAAEARQMRAEIERRARRFVALHWSAIHRLAHVLHRRGSLDKYEIMDELDERAAVPVKLNQAGVDHATALVFQNKLNFSPFTWDSPDTDTSYFLGVSDDGSSQPQLLFPFGKGNEIYIEALSAAAEEGGTVGEYAGYLLSVIEKQKKQSYQPKRGRSYGRNGDILWRTDGYLVPLR